MADFVEDMATPFASSPNNRSTASSSRSSPRGVEVPWALMYCTSDGAIPADLKAAVIARNAPSWPSAGAVM